MKTWLTFICLYLTTHTYAMHKEVLAVPKSLNDRQTNHFFGAAARFMNMFFYSHNAHDDYHETNPSDDLTESIPRANSPEEDTTKDSAHNQTSTDIVALNNSFCNTLDSQLSLLRSHTEIEACQKTPYTNLHHTDLLKLPTDIKKEIFKYFDSSDFKNLKILNRSFYKSFKTSKIHFSQDTIISFFTLKKYLACEHSQFLSSLHREIKSLALPLFIDIDLKLEKLPENNTSQEMKKIYDSKLVELFHIIIKHLPSLEKIIFRYQNKNLFSHCTVKEFNMLKNNLPKLKNLQIDFHNVTFDFATNFFGNEKTYTESVSFRFFNDKNFCKIPDHKNKDKLHAQIFFLEEFPLLQGIHIDCFYPSQLMILLRLIQKYRCLHLTELSIDLNYWNQFYQDNPNIIFNDEIDTNVIQYPFTEENIKNTILNQLQLLSKSILEKKLINLEKLHIFFPYPIDCNLILDLGIAMKTGCYPNLRDFSCPVTLKQLRNNFFASYIVESYITGKIPYITSKKIHTFFQNTLTKKRLNLIYQKLLFFDKTEEHRRLMSILINEAKS